jgi:hypothetical protein
MSTHDDRLRQLQCSQRLVAIASSWHLHLPASQDREWLLRLLGDCYDRWPMTQYGASP